MGFPILVRRHLYIESGPWLSAVKYIVLMNNWVPFTLSDRKPQWRKSVHLTIIPWAMLSENCHITDLLVIEFRWSVRLFNGDEFSVVSLLSGVECITLINDWVQFTLSYPKLQSRNSFHHINDLLDTGFRAVFYRGTLPMSIFPRLSLRDESIDKENIEHIFKLRSRCHFIQKQIMRPCHNIL